MSEQDQVFELTIRRFYKLPNGDIWQGVNSGSFSIFPHATPESRARMLTELYEGAGLNAPPDSQQCDLAETAGILAWENGERPPQGEWKQ